MGSLIQVYMLCSCVEELLEEVILIFFTILNTRTLLAKHSIQ